MEQIEIWNHVDYNNLGYLIDPTFRKINRLFIFSFKNGNNYPTRYHFGKHDMTLVEIKDINAMNH